MNETNIMLDLETMGIGPDAAIIAIGAVVFDVDNGLGEEFYTTVSLESSVKSGGKIDPSTVLWWMKQDDDARHEFVNRESMHIDLALARFTDFVTSLFDRDKDIAVWGNGANFDNVILRSAFERSGYVCPWFYNGDRCFRTLRRFVPDIDIPSVGTAHNALDDAKWQALYAIEALRRIRACQ